MPASPHALFLPDRRSRLVSLGLAFLLLLPVAYAVSDHGLLFGLAALLGDGDTRARVPEDRLAQEVALLATRSDVREVIDRLGAHIAEARTLLESGVAVGRKLEFLTQEFVREANTLCSKSASVALTRIGLSLKAAIERFREQSANVE